MMSCADDHPVAMVAADTDSIHPFSAAILRQCRWRASWRARAHAQRTNSKLSGVSASDIGTADQHRSQMPLSAADDDAQTMHVVMASDPEDR